MDDLRKAAEMALEALRNAEVVHMQQLNAMYALQEALAQPELVTEQMIRDRMQAEKFAELVRADEREACALACIEVGNDSALTGKQARVTTLCAKAIIARGEK